MRVIISLLFASVTHASYSLTTIPVLRGDYIAVIVDIKEQGYEFAIDTCGTLISRLSRLAWAMDRYGYRIRGLPRFRSNGAYAYTDLIWPLHGFIGVNFGSSISEHFSNLIIIPQPRSLSSPRIFLSVDNPEIFCNDNRMAYINSPMMASISLTSALGLNLEVHTRYATTNGLQCLVDTKKSSMRLPEAYYSAIVAEIRMAGFQFDTLTGSTDQIIVGSDCVTLRHGFPTITLTFHSDDNEERTQLVIHPEDYVTPSEVANACRFHLQPSDESPLLTLLTLGTQFLSNTVFMIDYTNNRYGFCHPK